MSQPTHPGRRRILTGMAGLAGAGAALRSGSLAAALLPTPVLTPGPFYPLTLPLDSDDDLVHVAGHAKAGAGIVAYVGGRVLDRNGRPIRGARVEIWQCDANGRYRHPGDANPAPEDDGFQGYGHAVTAADGGYRFRTIRPVPYPGRTAHIHFKISSPGRNGLVTQLYVAGEPRNADDLILNSIDVSARQRVIVPFLPAPEIEDGAVTAAFDIVLGDAI